MALAAETLLQVVGVRAGYLPDLDILQGVNLEVYRGELVTLIGPNGAGKSTLAKTIFGLLIPRQGTIHLAGEAIGGRPPHELVRLGMAYVPQIANVFPSLSVAENLEMGAYQARPAGVENRRAQIYELFPLLGQRHRQRAGTLSGGERQMLAMGRALMANPQVLILDEPSAALSPKLVDEVFAQIRAINQAGVTIILVEQNAHKALQMADRGYVLENGRDRFTGPGPSLLHDPQVAALYLGGRHDPPSSAGNREP